MQLRSAAQTDIGLVRSENEDRFLCADDLRLYAVADGIGGLPGGAEAAETAISALRHVAGAAAAHGREIDLVACLEAANDAVLDLASRIAPDTGLGTTLCVSLVRGAELLVANVGDSRCYLFREGKLQLLTTDDTVENEVLRRRARGERVELEERYRNALTRCIGQPMPLEATVQTHALRAGDRVLVCSDGICRLLSDASIAARLEPGDTPAATLAALIAAALERGGADNATGVLVQVGA